MLSALGILGGIFALVGARQVSLANERPVDDMPAPTACRCEATDVSPVEAHKPCVLVGTSAS